MILTSFTEVIMRNIPVGSNVCLSILMPTHCTITCFGFRTRRIDGVKCGLFSNHERRLGRPHYVWEEYLYSVVGS